MVKNIILPALLSVFTVPLVILCKALGILYADRVGGGCKSLKRGIVKTLTRRQAENVKLALSASA
jgi:hypothetical protein